ncbi:MAG: DnaA N-terminal domain-containing protein, partial [Cyclobacteriaceae bacterium]
MEADSTTVWNDCLEILKHEVDEQNFNTWFKPIVPLRNDGDVLTIQVPSQFFYEWLEEHYVPVLKKAVNTVLGPTGKLEYSVVVDSGNKQNPPLTVNYPNGLKSSRSSSGNGEPYSPFSNKALNPQTINSRLNAAYTFEN